MAERESPPRLIPNFAMDKPWTEPMTPEEEEGLAMTGLLSGAPPTDRAITQLLGLFSGDYVIDLSRARG